MLNKVQFIGHLGKDPEVRYMPSGEAVANFSVASTERWKDKTTGEMQERTEWLRCSAWGKLAEICGEYLVKGKLVFVEGSLQARKYTDKDGVERQTTEAKLTAMKMLGGKDGSDDGGQQRQAPAQRSAAPAQRPASGSYATPRTAAAKPAAAGSGFDDMEDDIPF